jgi:hypothetical protein
MLRAVFTSAWSMLRRLPLAVLMPAAASTTLDLKVLGKAAGACIDRDA